jgi:hypothetical protein
VIWTGSWSESVESMTRYRSERAVVAVIVFTEEACVIPCALQAAFLAQRRSPLTPVRGRGFNCGLKVERSWRVELAAGQVLRAPPCVCVACTGTKRGFKSPVNRTNIEEQKELLAMRSTTRGQFIRGLRQPPHPCGARRCAPV